MGEGAIWFAIAGIASLVCGLLVAATAGGAPAGTATAAVVVVVVAVGLGLVVGARHRRPHGREHRSSALEVRTGDAAGARNVHAVKALTEILWPADIEWVRNETFRTPWRCNRIASFRLLLENEHRLGFPPEPSASAAFAATVAAVGAFVTLYDATTIPEQLLLAGDWQEVRGAKTTERGETELLEFEQRCTELSGRGFDVARCYDRLLAFV